MTCVKGAKRNLLNCLSDGGILDGFHALAQVTLIQHLMVHFSYAVTSTISDFHLSDSIAKFSDRYA